MSRIRSTNFHSITFFLLLLLLESCATRSPTTEQEVTESSIIDNGWLIGEPCKAPCLYGLEPGKTSVKEAIDIIQRLPFINPLSVTEQTSWIYDIEKKENVPGRDVWGDYRSPGEGRCIFVFFKEDVLYEIYLLLDSKIAFEEVVSKFGQPDGFIVNRINAETKGCSIGLIWYERQMEIQYSEPTFSSGDDLCDRIDKEKNQVPPGLVVENVHIMDKAFLDSLVIEGKFISWSGFSP